ncbi:hypothetical protein PR202_ga02214 [Eleusine coracana subsp. coracana]|uniref:C2H2-type domain-containing protein n=1 Tax=Eleusine coracana subsp. coracana TaxID=191504 RepID=A0AAV5BJJ0_ELECO|nr:hypothetical protein PR202_ga02214 [Eleusine coracana subsp. coracana]
MAMVVENQQPVAQLVVPAAPPPLPVPPQAYTHHCKVCKKGFVCGRALGGHMRAHGVNDDDEEALDDDDAAGPCDDSTEAATTSQRMSYALRANPGRPKSCRVCENCGKEFTSWKSLLDHGRCNYNNEEEDSVMRRSPPPRETNDDDGEEVEEADLALAAAGWSKGKRTRRGSKMMEVAENGSETEATTPSREEEDLAHCLVMLSSSSRSVQPPPAVVDADQELCAPASNMDVDVERNSRVLVPQPISMMAPTSTTMVPPELKLLAPPQVVVSVSQPTVPRGLFECKACKKVFTSHQALGGHRASHKKVKGCYAAKLDSNQQPSVSSPAAPNENIKANNADGNPINCGSSAVVMATATAAALETTAATTQFDEPPAVSLSPPVKKKGKVHECSICHRVFMSGQALGGHKRCHWLTTGSAADPTMTTLQHHPVIPRDHHLMRAVCQQLILGRPPMFDAAAHHPTAILDLNVATTNTTKQPAAELINNAPATSLYMPRSWTTAHSNNNASNVNKTAATSSRNDATEDEADSRSAKKCKVIGDLKDMNVAGETSPWLQVGIGLPSETTNDKSVQE